MERIAPAVHRSSSCQDAHPEDISNRSKRKIMSPCHLNNGIDYGTGIYSLDTVTEQPVLSASCECADDILTELYGTFA